MSALETSVQAPRRRAWTRYASPQHAVQLAQRLQQPLRFLTWALALPGVWLALGVAPSDHQQGEVYRILFVHVPTAWLSMVIFVAMALWSAVGWVWNTRASFLMARALAPTGAGMTALALWTGAVWGRPTWGTWWVWDARLTSELVLLFLYLGALALPSAIANPRRADRAVALLSMLGALNVPIIYGSVLWWNTLHQGASLRSDGHSLAPVMLAALLLCTGALWAHVARIVLQRFARLVQAQQQGADGVWRLRVLASVGDGRTGRDADAVVTAGVVATAGTAGTAATAATAGTAAAVVPAAPPEPAGDRVFPSRSAA